jgi:perosamine synthetase
MTRLVPVNEPLLDGKEKDYINECLDTGWISSEGAFVERFEQQFAARVDRKFGIAVCNGSAALEAAVAALGIGPGDEVILPTFTIISCAAAIVRIGATPVLVDSDRQTWNMNVNQVADKINRRTRAIMAVHIYGLPVDMEPLLALARKHGLLIIEDTAEMIGQTYDEKPCGSFGDISTFSFYSNKHVTTGEGGMIVTDDEALAHKCRSLRNLCFQPEKRFVHNDLGWNMRITNLQAALGLAQLERLDQHIDRKRRMGRRYTELLENTPGLQLPLASTNYAENIYWVYGMMLKEQVAFDAREAMGRLRQLDIATRPFFWPMHEQPVFQKMRLFGAASFPVAEQMARRGFYVPSGLALSDQQMERTVSALKEIMS